MYGRSGEPKRRRTAGPLVVKLATEAALESPNNWLLRHLIDPIKRKSRAHKSLVTYVLAQAGMHKKTTGVYTQQPAHQ